MAKKTGPVKIGIVGCGRVTEDFHLPSLQSLSNVKVLALSDINKNQLNRVAARFNVGLRYEDPFSVIKNPEIDTIAICVPTQFHYELAMAVMDADKHLFIEKPLTLSLEESENLINKSSNFTKKVMVGFNLRWHVHSRKARQLIEEGKLGPIELVRTVITSNHDSFPGWRKQRDLGGGVLFEVAIHHFDLLRFLLHTEVDEIFVTSRSGNSDDEVATVSAKLSNGVLTSSVFSIRSSHNNEVEIYGHDGSLKVSFYHLDGLDHCTRSRLPGAILTRLSKAARSMKEMTKAPSVLRRGGVFKASYRAEWQHFVHAIRNGKDVQTTLEDGRRALQVVLSAIESSIIGKPVKVPNALRRIKRL